MKKASAIALAFFMLQSIEGTAQIYFDNLYGEATVPNGIGSGATTLIDGGYLCWAIKNGDDDAIYVLIVDEFGDIVSEFYPPLPEQLSEMAGAVHKLNDSLYIGNVYRQDRSETQQGDPELIWFRPDGSYFERRYYGMPERTEINPGMILCSDGGYAIGGQVINGQSPNEQGDGYLLKIDSLRNETWSQTYGGNSYDGFNHLLQTPDHGFLLLGWTRSYGAGQRDFYPVKTDSVGNQEWQQTYGDAGFDSGSSIITLNDGNYLLAGYRNLSERRQGYLYKIDPSGTVIWENEYGESNTTEEFNRVLELPDGSIVAAGLYDPYGASTSQSNNGGLLVKTDSEGNELWRRVYQKNNNTDLFYSVLLANDGGFLLSGQARNAETNSQDAWLLKVDSVGCPYPDCLVGVDEVEKSKVVVDVWPNPASEVLNIELQQPGKAEVRLVDMTGRPRTYPTLEAMKQEISRSRWYGGIHFKETLDESLIIGERVAREVIRQMEE